jgi:hypothetical protein
MPPLPPPLPPETRTVGQVIAEALKLYGSRFLPALALGLPLAIADQLTGLALGGRFNVDDVAVEEQVLVYLALAPVFAAAYAAASAVVAQTRPDAATYVRAVAVGTLLFVPAALLIPWFSIAAVLWLALVGLAVPIVIVERKRSFEAVRRGVRLARADYVHVAGGIAALVIVFWVAWAMLVLLLRSQADNTVRIAVFLADVVLSPVIFLGAALLYFDQEARSRIGRGGAVPRR